MEENAGKKLAYCVGDYVRELSRYINLERLDGITIAVDYNEALLDLDRGCETDHRLTPSSELVEGVAMAPSVIRDGVLKSHLVLNAAYIFPCLTTRTSTTPTPCICLPMNALMSNSQ
ncbi:hypothetical protein [Sinorhizobium alkalisoli]|nr:hypothetical protein [Sinorhizobium alkalisoli]QFI70519.1 hypothetical protein EKH55_5645 [Sinorhizobium alkalisoli]